jgi:hypothetical protein
MSEALDTCLLHQWQHQLQNARPFPAQAPPCLAFYVCFFQLDRPGQRVPIDCHCETFGLCNADHQDALCQGEPRQVSASTTITKRLQCQVHFVNLGNSAAPYNLRSLSALTPCHHRPGGWPKTRGRSLPDSQRICRWTTTCTHYRFRQT